MGKTLAKGGKVPGKTTLPKRMTSLPSKPDSGYDPIGNKLTYYPKMGKTGKTLPPNRTVNQ